MTALRPMSIGEILDRTFYLYRNNFILFAGIATLAAVTLVVAPVLLLVLGFAVPLPGAKFDPGTDLRAGLWSLVVYMLVVALFYLIGGSLATAATVYAVSKVHLGQAVNISEAYRKVFPRLGRILAIVGLILLRIIGLLLLLYAAAFAIGIVVALGLARSGASAPPALFITMGAIIVIFVVTIYFLVLRLYFKYSLAIPAYVLENTRASDALKRSAFLTKGSLGRIFLVYLLMGLMGAALSLALHLPANLLARTQAFLVIAIWQFLGTFVASSLSFPISTIAISLLYYDQRVRKEAFDLELLMESIGQNSGQTSAAPAPIG